MVFVCKQDDHHKFDCKKWYFIECKPSIIKHLTAKFTIFCTQIKNIFCNQYSVSDQAAVKEFINTHHIFIFVFFRFVDIVLFMWLLDRWMTVRFAFLFLFFLCWFWIINCHSHNVNTYCDDFICCVCVRLCVISSQN